MRASVMLALGFAVGLTACSDAGPGQGTGEGGDDEADALRLGRVHLVLSTPEPEPEPEPEVDGGTDDAFELTARFAMVRGLDEEFVRARADMPELLEDMLSPGQCAVESALWPTDLDDIPAEPGHELVLVDAGDLEVQLGETRLDVPLSLVPDLLPYMSGVEYAYFSESSPALDEADQVVVAAAGGQSDDLPPFSVDSPLPDAIDLSYTAEDLASLDDDALVLRWNARLADGDRDDAEAEAFGMRLTPLSGGVGGEPLGDDLLCVVSDLGQTRLELGYLRTLGFAADADAVRIEASRTRASLFDVGAWAGTELVIERRDAISMPLR
ncbi:MAG: hypothetical protein NXI35_26860 [bacterium]|nr:hypothetical protein [bacterium]